MTQPEHPIAPPRIPPSKIEDPVPVLVGRWMMLGCAATLAVLAVAFLFGMYVVIHGMAK